MWFHYKIKNQTYIILLHLKCDYILHVLIYLSLRNFCIALWFFTVVFVLVTVIISLAIELFIEGSWCRTNSNFHSFITRLFVGSCRQLWGKILAEIDWKSAIWWRFVVNDVETFGGAVGDIYNAYIVFYWEIPNFTMINFFNYPSMIIALISSRRFSDIKHNCFACVANMSWSSLCHSRCVSILVILFSHITPRRVSNHLQRNRTVEYPYGYRKSMISSSWP